MPHSGYPQCPLLCLGSAGQPDWKQDCPPSGVNWCCWFLPAGAGGFSLPCRAPPSSEGFLAGSAGEEWGWGNCPPKLWELSLPSEPCQLLLVEWGPGGAVRGDPHLCQILQGYPALLPALCQRTKPQPDLDFLLQVYKERVYDLLEPRGPLNVWEQPGKGAVAQGLSFHQVWAQKGNKGWDRLICTSAERAGNPGDTGVCRSQVPPGSWLAQTWPRAATGPQSRRVPRPQCPGLLGLGVSGCCVQLLIRPLPVLPQPTSPEQLLDMLAKGNKNRAQRHTKANATSSCSHAIFQVRAAASGIAAIAAGNGAGKLPGPACQGCPPQQ